MKKKVLAVILTLCMGASLFGCGSKETASDAGKEENSEVSADAEDEENAEAGEEEGAEVTYKIGISQFAEHGSLDNCRQGFLEGLKEEGIEEGKSGVRKAEDGEN